MVSENPFIVEFIFFSIEKRIDVNAVELSRLIAKYPLIENLDFSNYSFKADDAIMCIRKLHLLTKFKFKVEGQLECDRLLQKLDGKWKTIIQHENDGIAIKLTS